MVLIGGSGTSDFSSVAGGVQGWSSENHDIKSGWMKLLETGGSFPTSSRLAIAVVGFEIGNLKSGGIPNFFS